MEEIQNRLESSDRKARNNENDLQVLYINLSAVDQVFLQQKVIFLIFLPFLLLTLRLFSVFRMPNKNLEVLELIMKTV